MLPFGLNTEYLFVNNWSLHFQINWLDGDGNLIPGSNVEVFQDVLADGKRTNVKSVLKLSPKKGYHNKNITCQAQNAAERSPRRATLLMEVKYAPKVTVTLEQDRIVEFEPVRLSCHAEANPPNVVYKWYINDEIAYGDYSTQLTIASVTRKFNLAAVKCQVTNAVGKSEATQTLNVQCKLLGLLLFLFFFHFFTTLDQRLALPFSPAYPHSFVLFKYILPQDAVEWRTDDVECASALLIHRERQVVALQHEPLK